MKRSRVVVLLAAVVAGVSLAACGGKKDKKDYRQLYMENESKLTDADSTIKGLRLALASFDSIRYLTQEQRSLTRLTERFIWTVM